MFKKPGNTQISALDASLWRERWAGRVRTPDDLVRFVDDVGCCTQKPLPRYPDFPNQEEVMGERAPGVSDPWFWKDDMHSERRIYYTRVFGGNTGFISYELLPAFVATNGAVYDELLYEGALTVEAQQIYQAIEAYGPIGTKKLKRLLTPDANRSASRILIELERKFLITKTGITGRTMGTYSYIWDLVERWMPDVLAAADTLGHSAAQSQIRNRLITYGIAPESAFYLKILGWKP